MFKTLFHTTTTATPEQYVAGLTDFGPGRAELFGNSADSYLKVHSMGATEADVTEGSGGVWERLHYDWSDPDRVVLTTTDSNAWGGRVRPHLHLHAQRRRDDRHRLPRRPRGQEPQGPVPRAPVQDRRQGQAGEGVHEQRQGDRGQELRAVAGRLAHVGGCGVDTRSRLSRPRIAGARRTTDGGPDGEAVMVHGARESPAGPCRPLRRSRAERDRASQPRTDGGEGRRCALNGSRLPRRPAADRLAIAAGVVGVLLLHSHKQTTPVTHRTQFVQLSDAQQTQLGSQQYAKTLRQDRAAIVSSGAAYAQVQRVAKRIEAVAGRDKPAFAWKVTLLREERGQRLLPAGRQDRRLHRDPAGDPERRRARDGARARGRPCDGRARGRADRAPAPDPGRGSDRRRRRRVHAEAVLRVVALLGAADSLPFSRSQESEADHIGLVYMARAGYDPHRPWPSGSACGGRHGARSRPSSRATTRATSIGSSGSRDGCPRPNARTRPPRRAEVGTVASAARCERRRSPVPSPSSRRLSLFVAGRELSRRTDDRVSSSLHPSPAAELPRRARTRARPALGRPARRRRAGMVQLPGSSSTRACTASSSRAG